MKHLAADYFEKKYSAGADPWRFDTRWYEARKRALTLAALPKKYYVRAFEPGCANGALTEQLADRCDELIATDLVASAAERARRRLKLRPHVHVGTFAIPEAWPDGWFDLIVLSEVVYYLTTEGVEELLDRVDRSLLTHGHVIAVHWTGKTDYPLTGDEVHALLDAHRSFDKIGHHREKEFVLSVYERVGA